MSDDGSQETPPVSFVVILALFGAMVGGIIGFWVRGSLNEQESIGFGNIPDQLLKLLVWTALGAALCSAGGAVFGAAIDRRSRD